MIAGSDVALSYVLAGLLLGLFLSLFRPIPALSSPGVFALRVPTGRAGRSGRHRIHCVTGPDARLNLPRIPEDGFVEVAIGRAPDRDRVHLVLSDPTVSRRHGRLRGGAGIWELVSLAPHNPVLVNGAAVSDGTVALKHGDELQFGRVRLRFLSCEVG